MPGWCNGSAGYVFLWTTAAKVLGKDSFLELAEGAAWNSWESAQREGSLCCGLVGRAYALLDLFQAKGETQWLDRAHDLARIAAREGVFESDGSEGLFKGQLGLALLAADLQRPDRAWFPFLGPEPGFG
jgi:serine/threonine-protein kinase